MSSRQLPKFGPYFAAIVLIAVASVAVALFAGNVAVLIAIYFAAVTAAGWYGGFGPALVATVLSYLVANWYFIPPDAAFVVDSTAFVYVFVCLVIATFSEISKRSLRRAKANAEQVKVIVESITDGFVVVDGSWQLTYVNRATEEFQRRHARQMGSRGSLNTFPLTFSDSAQARLKSAALNRVTVEFEEFYEPWQRWLELKASPTDVDGLAIYFRDITERKRSEEELRRMASIIESSEDAVIGMDLDARIISWNQAAEKLYGYSASEVIGHSVTMLLPPDEQNRESEIEARIRRGERVRNFDAVRMTKDGRRIDVSLAVSVIRNANGAIVGYSKIARDIGDRKRAEQALREADRRKDDFLALLGHELRNPLAGIVNGVQVLNLGRIDKAEAREVQAIIERQAAHMSRLIDDLLDVSRIVRGKVTLDRQRLDLAALVRQSVEDQDTLMEQSRLTLAVDTGPDAVWVDGDPVRLAQVVDNLLSNAMKFTDPGGRVCVSVRAEPATQSAVLLVRDSGVGIAPDTIATLFEPFAQAKESLDRNCGGLGLGLAVVKGLIELHRGTIEAASEGAGKGATFTIRLPLSSRPEPQVPETGGAATAAEHLRVLVVDDNRDVLHLTSKLLKLSGHTVATAKDGSTGVEVAREFHPDLVLCDIGLPGEMNGYKVAQSLRADPATRGAHLVAITGFGQAEDRRRAIEAGFDRHLTKPVGYAALVSLIAELEHEHPVA